MDWKKILIRLGYYEKCNRCGTTRYSRARLLTDIFFIVAWFTVLYLYFTVELPYIRTVANCAPICQEMCGSPYVPSLDLNNTTWPFPQTTISTS